MINIVSGCCHKKFFPNYKGCMGRVNNKISKPSASLMINGTQLKLKNH